MSNMEKIPHMCSATGIIPCPACETQRVPTVQVPVDVLWEVRERLEVALDMAQSHGYRTSEYKTAAVLAKLPKI